MSERASRPAYERSDGSEPPPAPAFYGRRGGRLADWWTLLHPPYTLWHLSYVAIGAAMAPAVDWPALVATLIAFFLAVGVAAHALDERHGRPLGTAIGERTLTVVAGSALTVAAGIGVAGAWYRTMPWLLPLIAVGVVLVVGYNLELYGGRLHSDRGFALAWGGFPVLVGLVAQHPPVDGWLIVRGCLAIAGAIALTDAQRRLSTPARLLRRRVDQVDGRLALRDGTVAELSRERLLVPLEAALRSLCWAVPLLALALLMLHP